MCHTLPVEWSERSFPGESLENMVLLNDSIILLLFNLGSQAFQLTSRLTKTRHALSIKYIYITQFVYNLIDGFLKPS